MHRWNRAVHVWKSGGPGWTRLVRELAFVMTLGEPAVGKPLRQGDMR